MALRTLYCPIYEPGAYYEIAKRHKHGLRTAFEAHGPTMEWDYLDNEAHTRAQGLINRIEQFNPDLLFLQLQGPDGFSADELAQVRQRYPALKIANWNGDVWGRSLTSPEMLDILRHVDLQLVVNGSVLDTYASEGINAAFWPFGYETPLYDLPTMPAHEAVYLGNAYSEHRQQLERLLRALPYNVGIYGSGWQHSDGNTTYDFPAGEALYRAAKLTISDNQFAEAKGYLSNRPFQALAAGCFMLQQRVEAITPMTGLIGGVHFIQFTALEELPALVEFWLQPAQDTERRKIADAGQRFVRCFHSFEARVAQLLTELLPMEVKA